ncbi:MAG: NAD(+)/NADH kinase [Gammaproteobacteria bacterium]|nr:NAD(+)/NADH kinase [Gammaproteobacteria bacterium]
MSPRPRVCALVGKLSDPRVAESASALVAGLESHRIEILVAEDFGLVAPCTRLTRVEERELVERAELVIAIGGDGTLLYAARLVAERGTPLLGINRGRLGFLTDVLPQDMLASVEAALEGRCEVDRRPLLCACVHYADGTRLESFALNDVVLQKWGTGRMIDFETWIDGRYVNTHGGDGLIVATATGSTAYALSCGGPIVEPHLDVLVLAPICPHTLSDRPIIVSGRSTIDVRLIERPDTRGQVTCDGIVLAEFVAGDRLEVRPAPQHITLLHPSGHDYFRLLRSKLHWGRGGTTPAR